MNPNHITTAMIDNIAEHKISEMTKNPKKVLKELLHFSAYFSNARFKVPISSIIQYLLLNEDSQYYALIRHLLTNTSHSAIKNLGINIGYNSWTKGAQTIRETSQKTGYCIPWILIFNWNPASSCGLTIDVIEQFIQDANQMGIYSFCIRQETSHPISGEIFNLFSNHPDSTFFWFLPNQLLAPAYLDMIRSSENVLAILNGDGSFCQQNTSGLSDRNSLYGISYSYDSFPELQTNDSWLTYYDSYHSPLIVMTPDNSCDIQTQKQMASYVHESRLKQRYPYLLWDLYSDIRRISQIITGEDCCIEIASDGHLIYPKVNTPFQAQPHLNWYLAASMPSIISSEYSQPVNLHNKLAF